MFDSLVVICGCQYISDLKNLNMVQKRLLLDYLNCVSANDFDVKELNELVFYVARIQAAKDKETTLNLFKEWLKA